MSQLNKYKWGFGIEHEVHLFHTPLDKKGNNITEFLLYNSYEVINRILNTMNNSKDLSYDDYELLKSIPFEKSGRICNGTWVIKPVPILMPELITNSPFCSIKDGRNFKNMVEETIAYRKRLIKILMTDHETQNLVKKYGNITQYPYGMTRYLKYPLAIRKGKYILNKDRVPEYNGSYHLTMTLPYTEKTTHKEFINMHINFCNQLQWLEPLLLTEYFSGDENAPGSLKNVRGSFRVMIIGWGNLAGTDVRYLKKGIGRYTKTKNYWRKGLVFEESSKLKPCYKPSPLAKKEGAISSLSSDFRTFGPLPSNPNERISGAPMTKPNGVEFRIFDHFNDENLKHLVEVIGLVAENSRVTKTVGYVYKNKYWIEALHSIMKYGWKAELPKKYIQLLRKKLGLKIKTNSIIAQDVFHKICLELYNKNKKGIWFKLFHSNLEKNENYNSYIEKLSFPEINKRSWRLAFEMKLNNNKNLLKRFNKLSTILSNKMLNFKDFEHQVLKIMGSNWKYDVVDIAYYYKDMVLKNPTEIIKNKNGTIKNIHFFEKIPLFKNFNEKIVNHFESIR